MSECTGGNFILNGEILPSGNFDDSLVYDGISVYEVMRLMNSCPVFFHEHMERLVESVRLTGKEMLADIDELKEGIITLIATENITEGTIKIVYNYNESSCYIIYFIRSSYPTEIQYSQGVKGILVHAERRDPASKKIDSALRSSINQQIQLENAYEALLVNDKDEITEGSRSNIFFIRNEKLVTAPEGVVLNGITRKNLIKICYENNIDVEFRCVKAEEIKDFDGAFMSGTSPVVLPYRCIGEIKLNAALSIIEKLRTLYISKAKASLTLF
jgi:branched-chain amino acid aminotransferase